MHSAPFETHTNASHMNTHNAHRFTKGQYSRARVTVLIRCYIVLYSHHIQNLHTPTVMPTSVAIFGSSFGSTACVCIMADKPAKLRKLEQLRRTVPHVSASALSAILREVRDDMPELATRQNIQEARVAATSEDTPYGPIFTTLSLVAVAGAAAHTFDVINPFAYLYYVFFHCLAFRQAFELALLRFPVSAASPWRLIFYCDEVTPGNQLAQDNKRKVWAFYFSFLELGSAMLSQEDAWFCIAAMRTSRVANCAAGIAQAFSALVKLLFTGLATSLHRTGMILKRPNGTTFRFFARLAIVLQDGGAHKHVWCMKGDAGSKMCLLCRNLVSEKSEVICEDGTNLLTCSIIHEHELDFATDADIRGSVRRLAALKVTDAIGVFRHVRAPTCCMHAVPCARNGTLLISLTSVRMVPMDATCGRAPSGSESKRLVSSTSP